MTKFEVKYFAPYTFANFICEAASLDEAKGKWREFNIKNSLCIMNRELKSTKFGGKKVIAIAPRI
jgi:hypothetical protein